jgi:molybdopterin/thiamine biosynthesis adenylyltransferase/rhodanese-related sulfurtransferase
VLSSELPIAKSIKQRALNIELSSRERSRYARHLLLPEIGEEGQKALKSSRVLVVGSGGLGSPVGLYLAAAGVGHISLIDFDVVDLTNLQRQIIFDESDLGCSKAESAAKALRALNGEIDVVALNERLTPGNIEHIFRTFDVIVDGTDNFSTRYLINDAGVLFSKPIVYGSIFRFDGQASLFYAPHGPCYRCLFPNAPPVEHVPNCAEGGVLGVLPGIIGVIQATEVLKLLSGVGECLIGRLLTYDASSMKYGEFSFKKDPECAVCGKHATIKTLEESALSCGIGSNPSDTDLPPEISIGEFEKLRGQNMMFTLVDVRSDQERMICSIPGSLHIPLASLKADNVGLQRKGPIIFHCKTGQRSLSATKIFRDTGRLDVFSLKGGILAWLKETDSDQAIY